jgi:SPW repeat
MENSKSTIACDVVNLILGAFLFITPWLFNYAPGAESWNAWIAGAVIAALSVVALSAFAEWEEWLNLVVGLWVIVSPWVLSFSANATAMWTNVIVGIVVAVLAAVEIWLTHGATPRVTQMR